MRLGAICTAALLVLAPAFAPGDDNSPPDQTIRQTPTSRATSTTGAPLTTPSPTLTAALDPVWRQTSSGCLRVTTGDRVLYDATTGVSFEPASVTKLFTAVAMLETVGEATRFRTTVRAADPVADGVVHGDVWLVGGGDPVLGTEAWAAHVASRARIFTSLDTLADRVVAAGVRRVAGRVVGDESRYDTNRCVDTWPQRLIADGEAGPLSALSVNDGFRVWGHPGVPFTNPPIDAAALFAELLRARGVVIDGLATAGSAPAPTHILAAIDSPSVGELTHAMLRNSDTAQPSCS